MATRPQYRDDFDQPRRRGRLLPLSVALLALVGFASIVWYAYTWGVGTVARGGLPVVAAPEGPEKELPSHPGGLVVPHQDSLVLNEGVVGAPEPQVERLLPPPEAPQPPQPLAGGEGPAAPTPSETSAAVPVPPVAQPPAAVAEAPKPAETAVPPAAPQAAAPAPQAPAAGSQAAQPAPQPPAQIAEAPAEPAAKPAEKPAAKPATTAAPGAQVAAIGKGSHVLQLASVKSEQDAERAWKGMQSRFPDLLGGLQLKVERADLGSKGVFFRIVVGPFPNRSTASDLCAQLKAQRQDCIVRQF